MFCTEEWNLPERLKNNLMKAILSHILHPFKNRHLIKKPETILF